MSNLRILIFFAALWISTTGWADETAPAMSEDAKFSQQLAGGMQLIRAGNPRDAIPYFDQVIAGYEAAYSDKDVKFYSARWQVESLMYLMEAAASDTKMNAKVVSSNWAYAYYLKAYSLLELGNMAEAKTLLERAIALSPHNSQFLSEMGNIHQREKDWPKAVETFQAAAAAAEFSLPNEKNIELARAWRGQAYAYVEQGKLDEAEKIYRQCLELDANDQRALDELRYIQSIRVKSVP